MLAALGFALLTAIVHSRFKKIFTEKKGDAINATHRAVALFHHALLVIMALVTLSDKQFWDDRERHTSPLSFATIIIGAGYFLLVSGRLLAVLLLR